MRSLTNFKSAVAFNFESRPFTRESVTSDLGGAEAFDKKFLI